MCRRRSADLTQPGFQRIAIGLPASVPVGRYTKSVLEAAGIWAAIEPKMIGANNVRQVLDYVARAEVDAGFVYATDAALMPDKVKVALAVPTTTPILYPVAPIAASPNAALAHALRRVPGRGTGTGGAGQVRLRQALSDATRTKGMEGAWVALALTLKVAGWATCAESVPRRRHRLCRWRAGAFRAAS